jgi:hypothetical protein
MKRPQIHPFILCIDILIGIFVVADLWSFAANRSPNPFPTQPHIQSSMSHQAYPVNATV